MEGVLGRKMNEGILLFHLHQNGYERSPSHCMTLMLINHPGQVQIVTGHMLMCGLFVEKSFA